MCLWYGWMVSWIVNVCVGGSWMSEWSVDGMNVIVLHGLRAATHVENWTVPVYYDRSVWDWEGDKREKLNGNKECPLRRLHWFGFDWREWMERTQTISNQQCTFQQHYKHFEPLLWPWTWIEQTNLHPPTPRRKNTQIVTFYNVLPYEAWLQKYQQFS